MPAATSFLTGTLQVVAEWRAWDDGAQEAGRQRRRGCRRQAAGTRTTARRQPSQPAIAQIVMDHVRAVAKERAKTLTLDTNIVTDLGLDSLERLQIASSLEETFGGRFPEDVLAEIETVREVAAAIQTLHRHASRTCSGTCRRRRRPGQRAARFRAECYDFAQMPEYKRLKQTMDVLIVDGRAQSVFSACTKGSTRDTTHDRRPRADQLFDATTTWACRAIRPSPRRPRRRSTTSARASPPAGWFRAKRRCIASWKRASPISSAWTMRSVYVGGHATNESTIGHLFGPGDLILHDSLAHNSIIQGSILSGARRRPFPHNDWQALDELLTEIRREYRRVLVVDRRRL